MRTLSAALFASLLPFPAFGQTYTISTVAGSSLPVNMTGTSASLGDSLADVVADQGATSIF